MRGKTIVLVLGLLSLLAAGCGAGGEAGTTYDVYFQTQEEGQASSLAAEEHRVAPEQDPVEALLDLLLAEPAQEGLARTIPQGTAVRSWSQKDGVVTVDFSSRYGTLSGVELTLADYSVVLTLTQVEGVEGVVITADGAALPYRDHQLLTAQDVTFPQVTADDTEGETEEETA
jgi:germination protein M